MHGVVRGFTPRNRMEAARELIGHIAREELRARGLTATSAAATIQNNAFVVPADVVVVPAEAGTQRGGAGEGLPSKAAVEETKLVRHEPAKSASEEAKIVRPEPVEGQCSGDSTVPGPTEARQAPTGNPKLKPRNPPNDHRGIYDIDKKIAEAQHDMSHPVHEFVRAYDKVVDAFQSRDNENDSNDDVRKWISGEVRDDYGKYIWEYAPADPLAHRMLKPRRRRRSKPKAESIFTEHVGDRMRREGTYPPKRTLIWI